MTSTGMDLLVNKFLDWWTRARDKRFAWRVIGVNPIERHRVALSIRLGRAIVRKFGFITAAILDRLSVSPRQWVWSYYDRDLF